MEIIEKDFKIECDSGVYTLYFLKSKKELKEDSKDQFKISGYYNVLYNAIKAVYKWRRSKKYPFKEDTTKLKLNLELYKQSMDELYKYSHIIYDPIIKLKQDLLYEI